MVRRLAALLLAVVVPPAVTLAWLGVRLLEHDRVMLEQRELERRQADAQAVARMLEQALRRVDQALTTEVVPDGIVRLTATSRGIEVRPAEAVLWLPSVRQLKTVPHGRFADAERLEFQSNAGGALLLYERLARSTDRAVRAGALLRQARIHRREGRWRDALDAYERLAAFPDIGIEGTPADLLARRAIGSVLRERGAHDELIRHAATLQKDLVGGRWQIDGTAWHLALADLSTWTGVAIAADDRQQFSEAATALWEEWQQESSVGAGGSGRKVVPVPGSALTVAWRRTPTEYTWLVMAPRALGGWLAGFPAASDTALLTASGQRIAGRAASGQRAVKADASETGLPWTIAIAARNEAEQTREYASRRRLVAAGLGAILVMLAGTSVVLWRVVQRDLAVARVQTDFVSTVSHEFRTPLASLKHITELLAERDDMPVERRRTFYDALARNTERLQRLVESLLDFSRMEGSRKAYDLRPLDVGELAARAVAEFRRAAPHDVTIDLTVDLPAGTRLNGDAASLTNALWNLLDNAVKYSPEGRSIHVSVAPHASGVCIAVRDTGIGIPRGEQRDIFSKFVRGTQARALGIKGTGLGLALVTHIVRAHGGSIELESEEGVGSTFRVVFPGESCA